MVGGIAIFIVFVSHFECVRPYQQSPSTVHPRDTRATHRNCDPYGVVPYRTVSYVDLL